MRSSSDADGFIETRSSFTRGEVREALTTHARLAAFYLYLHRIRRHVERDPSPYTDTALAPIDSNVSAMSCKAKILTDAAA